MSEIKNSKGKSNILLIVVIVLLCMIIVGGGAFTGYYFATKGKSTASSPPKAKPIIEATFSPEDFTLNLADEDSKRFIKFTIYLAYDSKNEDMAEELELKKPHIRDAIIDILRAKKSVDVSFKEEENLKKEILKRLNPIFEKGRLTNVYFYDILVQ